MGSEMCIRDSYMSCRLNEFAREVLAEAEVVGL